MNELTTSIYLGIAVILIVAKLFFHGLRDLILPICLFYFYFSYGSVISYLMGQKIYFGTQQEFIPEASLIFLIGLSTMILFSFLIPPPRDISKPPMSFRYLAIKPLYAITSLYATATFLQVIFSGGLHSKIDKISLVNPSLHYPYLMIEVYLLSFFFLLGPGYKKWFYINLVTYLNYNLVIGERDFIFPLASILLHQILLTQKGRSGYLKLIGLGALLMTIGTAIFYFRDSSQSSEGTLHGILNQGSLLFINTFCLKLLHEGTNFFMGFTYWNSFLNLLPNWIYKTNFNTLDWFKDKYAAASTSGYGFALDAEGFINFSYPGVIVTFILLLLIQRKIAKNISKRPFYLYYSVFFTAFSMYSLRNDSLAFMKGSLYAIFFYIMIFESSKLFNRLFQR
jgi:hypothetical protein